MVFIDEPFRSRDRNSDLLLKIKKALTQIYRKGKEHGKRDCREKEPYRQWVMERVKEVKLPFNVEIIVPPPEPEPTQASKEEVGALRAMIAQLIKENEELRSKLHTMDKKNARLGRKREDDAELLVESRKRAQIKEDLKEKYQDCLIGADLGLTSLHKQLRQTEKECGEAHHWFELALKEKKALRDESEIEIQKLKLSLKNANTKVDQEHRLKEKVVRTSYVTLQI